MIDLMKSHSHKLNALGVQVALSHLGFKKTSLPHYFRTPDGRQCVIRVQPQFGEDGSFSIDINTKENFMDQLKKNVVIFVNYDKTGIIEFYECLDAINGTIEYVKGISFHGGRDQMFKRLVLRFDRTKTKLMHMISDHNLWLKFRSNSISQTHNVNSPHYCA